MPTGGVSLSGPGTGSKIVLQVGERRFCSSADTLTGESGYFAALLSGRWQAEEEGSIFIDADAGVFEHVLRYLRHGVLPVFYDAARGHDHALYLVLLQQARYFGIERLRAWVEDRAYLPAVETAYSAVEVEGTDPLRVQPGSDVVLSHFPHWTSKEVYVCPRGVEVHRGNPSACGRLCRKVQGDALPAYVEVPVLKTLVIWKRTVFHPHMCTPTVDEGGDGGDDGSDEGVVGHGPNGKRMFSFEA